MADLQKLLFEIRATVSDREVLATSRLSASVKVFAGRELTDGILGEVAAAIRAEADRLVADGELTERPDYLAAVVRRRLTSPSAPGPSSSSAASCGIWTPYSGEI